MNPNEQFNGGLITEVGYGDNFKPFTPTTQAELKLFKIPTGIDGVTPEPGPNGKYVQTLPIYAVEYNNKVVPILRRYKAKNIEYEYLDKFLQSFNNGTKIYLSKKADGIHIDILDIIIADFYNLSVRQLFCLKDRKEIPDKLGYARRTYINEEYQKDDINGFKKAQQYIKEEGYILDSLIYITGQKDQAIKILQARDEEERKRKSELLSKFTEIYEPSSIIKRREPYGSGSKLQGMTFDQMYVDATVNLGTIKSQNNPNKPK